MGYTPDDDVFVLKFPHRDGLEVRAEQVNVGTLLWFVYLKDLQAIPPETIEQMLEKFAGALVDWNVEIPAGNPVPATLDGLKALKIGFMNEIIWAWVDAMQGLDEGGEDGPLPEGSPNGGPSLEASIPMEPLSESQAS